MKIPIIFILICFLFSATSQSQVANESEIVISEENLIFLIKRIKEKRDAILLENDTKNYTKYKLANDQTIFGTINSKAQQTNSLQEYQLKTIYTKLQTLEYDIKELNALMKSNQIKTSKKGNTTVVTPPQKTFNSIATIPAYNNPNSTKNLEEISKLEKEIIALKKEVREQSLAQKKTGDPNYSKDKYDELIQILNSKTNSKDTLVIEKKELTDYPELLKKFETFKKEVYFDNNSKEIKEKQTKTLNEIISILKSTEKIDVYLKGYSSNKGNPIYNQKLSVQRTENVKKYLIQKGIHPSRILTQYHGIDYSTTEEEKARRVELSFLIRK